MSYCYYFQKDFVVYAFIFLLQKYLRLPEFKRIINVRGTSINRHLLLLQTKLKQIVGNLKLK